MRTPDREVLRLRVADILLSVVDGDYSRPYQRQQSYQAFLSRQPPDIRISLHRNGLSDSFANFADRLFTSEAAWALYGDGPKRLLVLGAADLDGDPYGVALLELEDGLVTVHGHGEPTADGCWPDPLQFPLGEILLINLPRYSNSRELVS